MRTISIDPGKRRLAVAIWDNDETKVELRRAFLQKGKDEFDTAIKCFSKIGWADIAVLEVPLISQKREEDPNNCIEITITGALLVGWFRVDELIKVHPTTWMGQREKRITEMRAKKRLSKEELERIEFPVETEFHADVWDAIGLGLYHFRQHRRGQ